MTLAKSGACRLTVYDGDSVAEHNLPNQWYGPGDVGKPKVEALRRQVQEASGIEIDARVEMFSDAAMPEVCICAVDSMDTRLDLWKVALRQPDLRLYIDCRMGAEVGMVLPVPMSDLAARTAYETNLFPSSEAFQAPCTSRATMYCAMGLAGIVGATISAYVNRRMVQPVTIDFRLLEIHAGIPSETWKR